MYHLVSTLEKNTSLINCHGDKLLTPLFTTEETRVFFTFKDVSYLCGCRPIYSIEGKDRRKREIIKCYSNLFRFNDLFLLVLYAFNTNSNCNCSFLKAHGID